MLVGALNKEKALVGAFAGYCEIHKISLTALASHTDINFTTRRDHMGTAHYAVCENRKG